VTAVVERTGGHARPHVGRGAELARTLAIVTAAEGRGIVLAGVPGVGKSHLLDLAAERLAADGWAPLRAQGDPARRQPFGAFGDLLPSLTGAPDRWALVLRTGLDHLVARAGPGRPVLVADDLHAFDPASAALVQQAVIDGRVRVLGSLRAGDPAPDAVTTLWKHDLVERIEVGPLAPAEVGELAEAIVGGPVDDATRARLWIWTEGNPLLVTEIVERARLDGSWRRVTDLWRLDAVPTGSPRLAGLLDERLAESPPAVVDLVDAVALAGRLPMAVADGLVGRSAVAAAERLRLARVRIERGRADVMLDHPLHGELRRTATTPERQASLRHRLLDVVEALDEADATTPADAGPTAVPGEGIGAADRALVAQWYLETGRTGPRTAAILRDAAERSWAGDDPERAAALARRAWELRPDDRTGHLLVSALARIGATDELGRVAPAVAAAATTDRVRVLAVLSHALGLFQFTNRPEVGLSILEEGARHVADPDWRDVLTAEMASYTLQMGDIAGAEALATPLLSSPNPRVAADAAAVIGPAAALQGRIADSIAAADRGLDLAASLTDDYVDAGQYLFHKLVALVDDGQVAVAEELARAAAEDLPLDDPFTRAFVAVSLGRTLRLRGRPVSAARWFREAAAAFETVRRMGFAAWSLAGLAAVLAEAGDADGARGAAAESARRDDHPIRVGAAEVARSLAWVPVVTGDLDGAVAGFDAAAEQGLASGELVHAGHALHDLVRVGRPERALARLERLVAATDSAVLGLYAGHARAAVSADRTGLEAVAGAFEALGCDLAAAEAWSEASRLAGGGASERRAAALAARCEGARTPLLVEAAPEVPLSPREREIALMAADGLHRRVIAERLVISTRTVDSHLQRIYRKLGVSNRSGLAEALREH
jgi:DNA-binding CsgD family transcriptional regulator